MPKLFKAGDVFLDRYQIIQPLGAGGMSEVYQAKDLHLAHDLVAIKFLHVELQKDSTHIKRFQQEVLLTRKVNSPYVVKTFDAEINEQRLYFVMEYFEGVTLKALIDYGELSLEQIILILASIVLGLESIHEVGIIHRDLKAENILITNEGQVKIMDFGVAKVQRNEITIAGEIVGSSCYMSPEVWKGEGVTVKSDIYSLGVLAYQMLTRRFPFDGETMMQIMYQHLEGEIVIPRKINPKIPKELNDLVLEMLEIESSARPDLSTIKNSLIRLDARSSLNVEQEAAFLSEIDKIDEQNPMPDTLSSMKIKDLHSNSYYANKLANNPDSDRRSNNWKTIARIRSMKKVKFSTFRFLLGALLTISLLLLVMTVSDQSWMYLDFFSEQLNIGAAYQKYLMHLVFFAGIVSLPVFVVAFSTTKIPKIFLKYFVSVFFFGLLLVILNYSYVISYLDQSAANVAANSPLFLAYLELTLPRAMQHLIDAALLSPVASEAFLSSANNWNEVMIYAFNSPPLIWIFHYNSLIIFVFLLLFINRSNLNFFDISSHKQYRLPFILFSLFIIEPYFKQYLVDENLIKDHLHFFRLADFEFVVNEYYLFCSILNWLVLLSYLLFASRSRHRAI